MIKKNLTISISAKLLSLAILTCGLASANSTIVATGVDWSRGASFWLNADGSDVSAYFGGVIFLTLTDNGHEYYRDTLCVDLFTDIYIGVGYESNVVGPNDMPGTNLKRVSWLVDNALLPTEGTYSSQLSQDKWVVNSAQGAGIQFAIWDIVHDGGDGFSSGRVQSSAYTDPGILQWAQYYESASVGKSSALAFIYLNVSFSDGSPAQTLAGPLFLDGGPRPNAPVPEPGTLMLGGVALIAIGSVAQRKRRAAR